MRIVVMIIGAVALLMGLLWIGQGTGLIMWPRESFMLAETKWAMNGAVLALVGALLLHYGRRL